MLASFGNTIVEYKKITPRGDGLFGVVKLDYDQTWYEYGRVITKRSRPSRNKAPLHVKGLPATARFVVQGKKDFIPLHEDLQKWMHSLCMENVPSMSVVDGKKAWASLTSGEGMSARFFTDFAGSSTHADYINGNNLDQSPMQGKPLVTGGAVLKILGSERVAGVDCYRIHAVNPVSGYRAYHPSTHFWLFFYPTISARDKVITRDQAQVEWLSRPFPQYNDRAIVPVFGLEGKDYNFIPVDRVRVLQPTEPTPSPYRWF